MLDSVGTGEKCFEAPGVEHVGGQHVSGRHGRDDITDDSAQPGHGGADGARRSQTEDVGDLIAGHDAAGSDRQQRHQAALRRSKQHRLIGPGHRQWAQHADLDASDGQSIGPVMRR